jgi:hypothetical protein
MRYNLRYFCFLIVGLILLSVPPNLSAMTATEILEKVAKQHFGENFRAALEISTFKGKKKLSAHSLWLVGRKIPDGTGVFVDFEEPRDSKGLRFLFLLRPGEKTEAYLYLPATGKTLPLALAEGSYDIGNTGLTMDDIRAFAPQPGQTEQIIKEEKVEGRDCFVVRITLPKGQGSREMWITKDGFHVIKSRNLGPDGKVLRTFHVIEFFRTERGEEFPRQEEVTVPQKGLRIMITQTHAVFGIEIPEQLMDPKQFGKYRWRM